MAQFVYYWLKVNHHFNTDKSAFSCLFLTETGIQRWALQLKTSAFKAHYTVNKQWEEFLWNIENDALQK